jgi:pimeloyl-ACP methyl ester carboxylesterase
MPTLSFDSLVDSLEIHYELSGSGPLLILHHGWGSRATDWEQGGWLTALEKYATLLVFDSVGHGSSTLSHNPADHTVEKRAAVVTALADEAGADRFGFLGFSMGGRTGLELAASAPERLSMLAIGGMHLLPPSVEAKTFERRIVVLRSGRAKLTGNDPLALAASHEALLQWRGAGDRMVNHSAPTLLFCGEDDPHFENAKESAQNLNYEFTPLPNTNHTDTFFSSDMAVRSVADFVSNHLTLSTKTRPIWC